MASPYSPPSSSSPPDSNGRTPPETAVGVLSGAVSVVFSNLGSLVFVFAAFAALTASVDYSFYKAVGPAPGVQPDQGTLVKVLLGMEGISLATEIVVGPIFAAIAVHTGRSWLQEKPAGLYPSVNFALNRYGRMFVPHMLTNILIRLGLLIIVPGVLYVMQYAFVDSVAALESKKTWAMGRSKKLTRSRRKRILAVFLPVVLITQVMALGDMWAMGQAGWLLWVVHMGQHAMFMTMAVAFYLMYAERTTEKAEATGA